MYDVVRCGPNLLLTALALMCFTAGCNFGDPLTGLPSSGCRNDRGCNNHGVCEIEDGRGVCSCDIGYTGSDCDDCEVGYTQSPSGDCAVDMSMNNTTNNTTNNTSNNTTTMCADDEILVDDMCIVDACLSDPCGDGTCTSTGDGTWECECPNGSTGISCPSCAAGCVNGACDVDGMCICDRGWAGGACNACAPGFEGAACDTCSSNAFGPNCDTCASINAVEPWWDTAYQSRQALIVYNPPGAATPVLDGVVVQHAFAHSQLVAMGADPGGADVRVVAAPDMEVNRLLGFNSTWNRSDTTIWFPTVVAVPAGGFDVFHVYSRNPAPGLVLEDPAAVLLQNRGWYRGEGRPVYSPSALSGGEYSIQLRQKSPNTLEVYFHDSGNNGTAAAQLRLIDSTTGAEVASAAFGASQGSAAVPADLFREFTGLPNSMRLEVIIDPGADIALETAVVYLGAQRVQSTTTSSTYVATLVRPSPQATSAPSVFQCSPETAP